MTVISVTTAGYREVHPLSRRGELFTMVVLTVGVATVLYTFSFVMARLVEGDLESRWVRRRRERMLDELTDHFIICGFGRMGLIIAQEFVRQNVPFVIIERNPDRMQQAIDAGFLAVEADASSEQVLKRVRIERARGFIAAVSTDAENVYAVLTARLLRPDLFIIGRAETEDAKGKLVRAGADRVVSPYQIGGLQLAQTALRPAVVDFVQIATSSENLELNMEQVRDRRRVAAGRTLDRRRQPAPAVRRGRGRHPARRRPHGVQSAARRPRCAPATISSCSATSTSCASSRPPPAHSRHGAVRVNPMAARILDGASVAAAMNAAVLPEVQRVHGRRRTAARPRHRARRRRSRLGDLRPQQGQSGRRIGTAGRSAPAAGDRVARRSPRHRRSPQRSPEHDGILVQSPLPAGDGARRRAAGVRRHRPGEGRRRLQPGQRRPAGAGPRRISRRARRPA